MNDEKHNSLSIADSIFTGETDKQYPDLKNVPQQAREILALRAFGVFESKIAERLGITQQAVSSTCKRYDPEGAYCMGTDARKRIIAQGVAGLCVNLVGDLKYDE